MSYPPSDSAHPTGPHPSPERLAALGDGPATAAEAAHLAACAPCAREVRAHGRLLERARLERDRLAPPLTSWAGIGAALRDEGLVAAASPAEEPAAAVVPLHLHRARRPSFRARWGLRAAAGLLLAAGGAAAGRLSAGAEPIPALAGGSAADGIVALLADSARTPQSQEEAIAVLTRAERDYRVATEYLAQRTWAADGADRPEVYQRRLAVMDEVASLTRAALNEAPHDPVLNQYFLASLSAREATLQQLGAVLPAGAQINRF